MKPIVKFKIKSQKRGSNYFKNLLTHDILQDVVSRITGINVFQIEYDETSYNKGRLISIIYGDWHYYVTFSEEVIDGRNSSVQSVPTAINLFFAEQYEKKKLFYYFLPGISGNFYTDYLKSDYKLMMTAGVIFLNIDERFHISAYNSIDQIISEREDNRNANRSNNSTYITRENGRVQIFAKVYGASKYESTIIAIAASKLLKESSKKIEVYHIIEKDLKRLPKSSIQTLESLKNIKLIDTDYSLLKHSFVINSDAHHLRSPLYTSHLLDRLGHKHCALCGCEIPEIIQGAHIWGVSQIAESSMNADDKLNSAIDGNNGLWLCSNHHKLFDSNIISLNQDGIVMTRPDLSRNWLDYLRSITLKNRLDDFMMNDKFVHYLNMRNINIPICDYIPF